MGDARLFGRRASCASAFALVAAGAVAQTAEPYRLVEGDSVEVSYVGEQEPAQVRIDIDGEIRLAEVGGLAIAGLTLDAAEEKVQSAIEEAGQFLDPRTSITIVDYAPVVVTGDVIAPGRFEYLPRMTVAAALGLSGGSSVAGMSQIDVARSSTQLEGDLRSDNLALVAAATRIARFEATLDEDWSDGAEPVETDLELRVDEARLALIPDPDGAGIDRLLADEAAILSNGRLRTAELLTLWAEEVETLASQSALYDRRLEVQNEVVQNTAETLAAARDLQERGLQTATRLSGIEQSDAEARSRALELESARVANDRAIAETRRQQVEFLHARRDEALGGLREARLDFDDQLTRYAASSAQLGLLTGGGARFALVDDLVVTYAILSLREDRVVNDPVTEATTLLPGDTLGGARPARGSGRRLRERVRRAAADAASPNRLTCRCARKPRVRCAR